MKAEHSNGVLPVKLITESLNKGKSDKNKITAQRVGRVLDALGLIKPETVIIKQFFGKRQIWICSLISTG